ncbi:MAG: IS1634 family transposase [Verrucomicrobia bacterium]|nr:IS1634 family transposase [Verrucomicrobiota bacterium]
MFISRVHSKGKDGRQYVSVLLRQSKRVGKSVVSKTLAILTELPDWLIAVVERAVKHGKDAQSIAQLAEAASTSLRLRCAESFGAVFLVHEVAKACAISKALGAGEDAKLALWQVCARVLAPATSLLAMIRLAGRCAAPALLGFRTSFNEDDLYANGEWLAPRQAKVEARLWRENPLSATPSKSLFLYDVTSSYFEGQHNAFADFGYNRDKTKGKKQLVMGLLTDESGEPLSVSLFPGNTSDLNTFNTQLESLKNTFDQQHITLVGDRGMIRKPQQAAANEAGHHYISALHKAEIQTLLKAGELQMEFFENTVHETTLEDGRRLVTRRNPARCEEIQTARRGFEERLRAWVAKANIHLLEHPRARVATQLKNGSLRLKRGHLNVWLRLEAEARTLRLMADDGLLQEHAKLDGCYGIVSDLPVAVADTQTVHDRYKDLAKVEADFRTLKHGHLEIRPWYVITEDNTRAHALTAMLALKIRRRLQSAWEPLNLTVETATGQTVSRQIPDPTVGQASLLAALGVELPVKAPPAGPVVVTRVELQKRRKSSASL